MIDLFYDFNYHFIDTVLKFNLQKTAICFEINTFLICVDLKRGKTVANTRRTQMTKKLFASALIELMQVKPYHKITVKEICEQADLNRTTFYLHYNDISALFNEIVLDLEEGLTRYVPSSEEEQDRVTVMCKYLEFIKDNYVVYRTLMSSDQNGGAKTKILTDILSARKDELPVFGSQAENKYVYSFIIDGSISIILRWIDSDFDMNIEDLANLMDKLCYTSYKAISS